MPPTTARRLRSLLAAAVGGACACAALQAQAQVIRCTDLATGKVTYTDGACESRESACEVEARKSEQALARERAEAAQAQQRLRERLAATAEAERLREEREERELRRAQRQGAQADPARSPACAQARAVLQDVAAADARIPDASSARLDAAQREMELACLGPEGYAQAEAARAQRPQVVVVQPPLWHGPHRPPRPHPPAPAPRPGGPYIKECSAFTCTDSNGKRYPRTGRGSFQEP